MNSTLNQLDLSEEQLAQICTSRRWQQLMQAAMPFASAAVLFNAADAAFAQLEEADWLEAFAGHPMIGDMASLEKKYAQGKALSAKEQGQVQLASNETLQELLTLNQQYRAKFGFIFIVCATNKSADDMLGLLKARIHRTYQQELQQAAIEQQKISHIRMEAYI
ncbi:MULTISPECIES: 2-oxo-4-hydroxy-4-carboxy-5-ureidoimidazoline decarboxylase [Vibrio]|uniref:2-oxo-4-hydroxy-4-carboxy-5-ureidoimidazoline decarboxylase n=1 Tax=Vibrio TaxID=662 RepID=UPI0005096B14|nr:MULTISPECIES: 2-oxo-4-hydroxy-4-carboxy-5-ureidoimidazoline decarboxylase [Vibrio]EKO3488155.1 2-oxo-4-hydroxy-4-carboxy-5-ureidoimidazoline decarboxylase [Vibrio fluvialis]EKO3904930.1 2-oxo-4-hydroxy-4-carboxy-5-ureidoimidazoline decarboxylase [Vibrio fluvialis]EMC0406662.1 2-oxo-4-hydroxy-4-carboxy-5-ureidoimidazoline decarboxylase [Vibrio fluvialis]MBY8223926.1 2-oxo-4-hydroxy-4-carboxy-5-ureidoimidazoline decarboxylase [Vibrio fluvialis]MCG6400812.1 2-oxo-4-hydroxy-4-carboxy-5-ureidoim